MDWENEDSTANAEPQKTPKKRRGGRGRAGLIVVLIVLIIVFGFGLSRCSGLSRSQLEWPTTGLATLLPEPDSEYGEVYTDSDDSFRAEVDEFSQSDFKSYVASCQDMGFTVDATNGTIHYEAYSEDGYHLSLHYNESSEYMSITLDAPIEMGTISWPTVGAGSLVPAPASSTGKIEYDQSNSFTAYVGETDRDAYSAYVDACIEAGFNVDYSRSEESFSADNAAGVSVRITYEGFNTMYVHVDVPDDVDVSVDATDDSADATDDSTAVTDDSADATDDSTAVTDDSADATDASSEAGSDASVESTSNSDDFYEMVDNYEAFMNEYCDFMETYTSSSDTASMLTDYLSLMEKYYEWAEQIDEIDDDELSAEESAYLLAAEMRILDRLAEIG